MACGLFPCGNTLLKEINMFLKSKVAQFPVVADCQRRMLTSTKYEDSDGNGVRKYPPHLVEVDAIQSKTTQIFNKVFFPDDTNQVAKLTSIYL